MADQTDPLKQARQVMAGEQLKPDELLELAKNLKKKSEFGYAWRILSRARKSGQLAPELSTELRQEQALCTYKDTHLNEDSRLERALEILGDGEDLGSTTDPESLGLAGAIHKRRWRVRNDKSELETALDYYRRGHESDRESGFHAKQGYPGINAAFVLDLLASLEETRPDASGATTKLADARRNEARTIRTEIVDGLPPILDASGKPDSPGLWWPFVTVAEAYFGLERYDEAETWLQKARALPNVDPWEFESTARQLTDLAKLREDQAADSPLRFAQSDPGRVLLAFLGGRAEGVLTAYLGKVGLALSGGGFRASLYHIGVLARLAELDVLRHVEVLSCVSGGSILGAYYYLELRELLRTTPDKDITRQDYIDLVKRIEKGFLEGVQTNVRTRVAAELLTNLKMIFLPGYSRTRRIGELYESKIYSKVQDGESRPPRWLTDLFIVPEGESESFHPVRENWRRRNKVPVLILNATTLNTGHNWQFTASWMGEPPTAVDPEIDGNYRLRRMYYRQAPEAHRRVRLGTAVGASACVPGIFEPIALENLYERTVESGPDEGKKSKITVRLVDGGVHDNQGVVGLLEQDCDVMLVSDASGQMGTDDDPSRGLLGVPLRSNDILMSRVRGAEYDDLSARRRSGLLSNLMFVHLKMDLDPDPVDWIGCDEPHKAGEDARPPERQGPLTPYGIPKTVQRLLAGIRTDLDSFNDAEAYALMFSGYRMTKFEFDKSITGFPEASPLQHDPQWRFQAVAPILEEAKAKDRILEILRVAKERVFKVWALWLPLRVMGALLVLAAVAVLVWAFFEWRDVSLISVETVGIFVLTTLATMVFGKWVMRIVRLRETITKIGIGIWMSVLGFMLARLHLHVFDKIYLWLGRLERLKKG